MKGRGAITLIGVVVGLAVAAPAASAATIRVNDDAQPPGCVGAYLTIQEGVDNAGPGDTVLVCPGYYNEAVTVGTDNLVIKGRNLPPDLTSCGATRTNTSSVAALKKYSVVQGFGGPAFVLQENKITLDSFVIKGPSGTGDVGVATSSGFGGYLLQNNLIQDNAGGVYFNADGSTQSKMTKNCLRQNNDPGFAAGFGIASDDLSTALVQGNRSYSHTVSTGTFADFGNPPTSVVVQGNITNKDAGGYEFDGSVTSSISGNIMSGSSTQALCIGPSNTGLVVQGNIFKLATGVGILVDSCLGFGATASTGLNVIGNISNSVGHGFYVPNDDSLQDSTIKSNIFKSTGGTGMWVEGANGNGGNTFTGNIAQGGLAFFGCRDDTLGAGTAGTDNTWGDSNIGKPHNLPMALCFPHK